MYNINEIVERNVKNIPPKVRWASSLDHAINNLETTENFKLKPMLSFMPSRKAKLLRYLIKK